MMGEILKPTAINPANGMSDLHKKQGLGFLCSTWKWRKVIRSAITKSPKTFVVAKVQSRKSATTSV